MSLEKVLAKFPVFEPVEGYNKLRCTLTGHELPKRVDDVKKYTETKKFITAFEVHTIREQNPDVFEDLDEKGVVGCKITKTVISADPADMRRHLEGKRFKKKLEWRKKKEAQGLDASSDEEEEEDEEDDEMEKDADTDEEEEDFEEDDDDEEEEEEEYPGLGKKAEASVAGGESYDFSVMDTEMEEAKGSEKKRKHAKNGGGQPAKKKAKKNNIVDVPMHALVL